MILRVLASYCVERKTKSTRKKEIKREGREERNAKSVGLNCITRISRIH
jgi:hypothetical protein